MGDSERFQEVKKCSERKIQNDSEKWRKNRKVSEKEDSERLRDPI